MSTTPGYELDMIADGGKGERPGYSLTAAGVTADMGEDVSSKHPSGHEH